MTEQLTRPSPTTAPARSDVATRDESRFMRWAGWSGVIASIAFLTTVVVANLGGPEEPTGAGDVLAYLDEVAASPLQNYIYGIAGIALCVIYVPMLFGVHRLLQRTAQSWFATAGMVMGMGLLLPAYVISTMEPGIGDAVAGLGSAAPDASYVVYGTLATAATVFFTAGSILTLCFGPLLWSVEALRTRAISRWLAWSGVITGVTGLVWFVWFTESGPVLAVLIVNVLGSLVFFFGLSAALIRAGRPEVS